MPIKVNRNTRHASAWLRAWWAATTLAITPCAAADPEALPCRREWTLLHERPHEPTHFTQGLLLTDGRLFESAGRYGHSAVYEKDPRSGAVLRARTLPASVFAEGLSRVGDHLVQLSWREQTAFLWTLSLDPRGSLPYPGEGWGLTTLRSAAGERLLLSDGSATLRLLHPDTLAEERRIAVTVRGRPLERLNELEMMRGELLANIWRSDEVAVIDPATGVVRAWFDFSALRTQLSGPAAARLGETDLNGLAWDEARGRLLVTGKLWPRMFELRPGDCAPPP